MISALRISSYRLLAGAGLAVLSLALFTLVLPDAAQKLARQKQAAASANATLERQTRELEAAKAQAERIRLNRQTLDGLMQNLPAESVGQLGWKLSQALFDLSGKHGVRLIAVKYGAPAREGAKGIRLEAVDVEFTAQAIYADLKSFMLALEGSKLPFAVVSAKLDESAEGAHLTIVLRAFRQLQGPEAELPGDDR